MVKTVLYIHQSAELYGSDKALFYLVNEINSSPLFNPIVIIPEDGPLKILLEDYEIKVIVFPVIKVSRRFFKLSKLISLPFLINRKSKELKKILKNEKIDIVHSNTLAVFLGAFFARRYKIKHIWHVHEIIRKPNLVRNAYSFLVTNLSQKVVFNSKASQDFLIGRNKSLLNKSIVNLNGMERDTPYTSDIDKLEIRKRFFNAKENDVVIALVGRISRWKGQLLLLQVFHLLNQNHKNLKLVFVGSSPPNQDYFVKDLQLEIDDLNLNENCKIIPFQENIWNIWDSIEIAVVPSTEPEPFGLVALEAMLAKKPVVAARHGGLTEIVEDEMTGYLFTPNDKESLEKALEKLILNKTNQIIFGKNGFDRAKSDFTLQRHVEQFKAIYQNI